MQRLFADGRIRLEDFGPKYRLQKRLIETPAHTTVGG
jgi:hypothetical protein